MHSAGDLQPQAAVVDAELRQQRTLHGAADLQRSAGTAHQPVHAGIERPIRLLAVPEMNSQILHAAGD
ncbi:hypothetical protein GCM10027084_16100 [Pseudoxanthomonas sangjuensis]